MPNCTPLLFQLALKPGLRNRSTVGAAPTASAARRLNLAFELRPGHGFPGLLLIGGQNFLDLFGGLLAESFHLLLLLGSWGHWPSAAAGPAAATDISHILAHLVHDALDLFLLLVGELQFLLHILGSEDI